MTTTQPGVRLFVCGTADRGDEGAALAAAARVLPTLPRELCAHIDVRRCAQLDPADLAALPSGTAGIVVDTMDGLEPGAVVALSFAALVSQPGARPGAPDRTTRAARAHPFREVLRAAAAARGSLPEGVFVGIGGKWFGYGRRFSRPVRAAIPALGAALVAELERYALAEASPTGQ